MMPGAPFELLEELPPHEHKKIASHRRVVRPTGVVSSGSESRRNKTTIESANIVSPRRVNNGAKIFRGGPR
jgi:hypothetical protein